MAHDIIPLDIGAVKAYGVDRWRAAFSWPVPDHEFVALATAVEDLVRKTIAASPGDMGTAFCIARELPMTVVHVLHAHAVVARIRASGGTPVCSPGAPWYAEALGIASVAVVRSASGHRRRFPIAVRIVRWGRELSVNASLPKVAARIRIGRQTWAVGTPHALLADHLARIPAWVATLYDITIPSPTTLPASLRDTLHDSAVAFTDACITIAQRFGLPCDSAVRATLRAYADAILTDAAGAMVRARARVAAHPMAHIALSSATHHGQRALACAVRAHGGQVTTAAHGGFVGLFNTPVPTWSEFALSSTYITYTEASAALCRRIHQARTPLIPNDPVMVPGGSPMYRTMRDAIRGVVPSPRIRRVMIIGFPQNAQRKYTVAASLGLQQLDCELRMMDVLRNAGYDVVYKAHPDRLAEVRGVFDGRADMITEDFQTSHVQADAFVFGSMRTTAFPIALATTKPIVALHIEPEPSPPFPDAFALLARRVVIVPATMDAGARVQFDPVALCGALVAAPACATDATFFDTYLAAPNA